VFWQNPVSNEHAPSGTSVELLTREVIIETAPSAHFEGRRKLTSQERRVLTTAETRDDAASKSPRGRESLHTSHELRFKDVCD
jgi:hypothetical protein